MDNKPVVAIWMMTYNHEPFIAQAIEGILNQKTTFPFKLFISDDNSSDRTASICIKYKALYPDKIEFHQNPQNNIRESVKWVYSAASGLQPKYMAACEGDDYWTDPLKLQKQVDFLDNNPDFSFCYHHVNIIQEADFKGRKLEMKKNQPEISTIENILKLRIWAHINSVLYRRESMPEYPKWLMECPSADWAILCIAADDKKIKYLNESMSVYRQHGGGEWSSSTEVQNYYRIVKSAKALKKYLIRGENRKHIYWPLTDSYDAISRYYKPINSFKFLYFNLLSKFYSKRYELSVRIENIPKKVKKTEA